MLGPLLPFLTATGLSFLWLLVFALTVTTGADWPGMGNLSPIGLAAVVAAAVLPLALIWAVTAVVSQTLDRHQSTRAPRPRRGGDDTESLARTVIMMQEQARRRAFLDSTELGLRDLCAHLGQMMDRLDIIDRAEMETQWALTSAGYPWAIPNTFLTRAETSGPAFAELLAERLAEDGPSAAAVQRFLRRHALLEDLAREHDEDRLLRAILEDGPLERVALLLEDVDHRMRALLAPEEEPTPAQLTDDGPPYADPPYADPNDDFGQAMIDPMEGLEEFDDNTNTWTEEEPGDGMADSFDEPEDEDEDTIDPSYHRSPPRSAAAPPAGGRGAPEPAESAEDIARRLPYPPLSGDEMASIQERVARSLSRTALGQSRAEPSPAKAGPKVPPRHGTTEATNQFDMFGDPTDGEEPDLLEGDGLETTQGEDQEDALAEPPTRGS